jgi:hypothetical protein
MRVKPVYPEHAAGLIDPQTKRTPFIDAETGKVIAADVPETSFWVRRLLAGELKRCDETTTQPVGNEPIAPLTTR